MYILLCLHTNILKHGFTVKKQECTKGSTSGAPRPKPRTVSSGQTSFSTPTDSPSLDQPPASQRVTPPQPAGGGVADDVFLAADEVPSGQHSPHKEFHSAVLQALKKPSAVEAAEGGQASGTPEAIRFLPCSSWACLTTSMGN